MTSETSPTWTFRSDSGNPKGLRRKIEEVLEIRPMTGSGTPASKNLFICMTPRSGSTYLSSMISANDIANTQEHFRIVGGALERDSEKLAEPSYELYIYDKIRRLTSDKGVFSVKCDWPQFLPVYLSGAFATCFPNAQFVYLTRSDILAQAISRYVATVTKYFHTDNRENAEALKKEVPFDYDEISEHMEWLIAMQSDWERFFASEGISPLRLPYEEISEAPADVLHKIAGLIDVDLPKDLVLETEFKVIRTGQNERLRQQFVEEHHRRLEGSRWTLQNA